MISATRLFNIIRAREAASWLTNARLHKGTAVMCSKYFKLQSLYSYTASVITGCFYEEKHPLNELSLGWLPWTFCPPTAFKIKDVCRAWVSDTIILKKKVMLSYASYATISAKMLRYSFTMFLEIVLPWMCLLVLHQLSSFKSSSRHFKNVLTLM